MVGFAPFCFTTILLCVPPDYIDCADDDNDGASDLCAE